MASRTLTPKWSRGCTPPLVFWLDAMAWPGDSGSPLYGLDTGRVYGIMGSIFVRETKKSILRDAKGVAYVIPIRSVRSRFEKMGVLEMDRPGRASPPRKNLSQEHLHCSAALPGYRARWAPTGRWQVPSAPTPRPARVQRPFPR